MDYLIEILIELILEGSFELSKTKKTPNWLRYPLIIIVMLIFIGTSAILLITGYLGLKDVPILGVLILILAITFIIVCIKKFKHIYIKRNPNSQESKEWTKFIEQICTKRLSELNDIQKNAVLCFYYDREMNIGGHVCFFDNYPKIEQSDMKEALRIVANKKYVSNFEEAITIGKEDNYTKTDQKYLKFSPCLTEYLEEYVENNREEIFKENKF